MGGEAVAQDVRADAFVDAGLVRGLVHGAVELPHGEGCARDPAGNSHSLGRLTSHQCRSSASNGRDSIT